MPTQLQSKGREMKRSITLAALIATMLFAVACSRDNSQEGSGEHGDRQSQQRGHGEEQGQQRGQEQSAVQFSKSDTYDYTRNGARLTLTYNSGANEFVGTVENTTDGILTRVRVEVHLSNGTELGPTTPSDLEPGESKDIILPATEEDFNTWSAHPEVGEEEANHQSDRR